MKKLLWIGDAGVPSGFANATHNIIETLLFHFHVTVLGLNYRGDPHQYPYPIYAAAVGGDAFGVGRMVWMCDLIKPDVIVVQNDGWNIPHYLKQLHRFKEYKDVPLVAVAAVDGKNFQKEWLDGVAHAIFWTEFAREEARLGGYTGPATVIPLGINTEVFKPMNKAAARAHLPAELRDAFIVGNVNRNQPRKRWDLLIKYFAQWITEKKIRDAYLYLHTAPTGDTGVDVKQLAAYYGVVDRLAVVTPETWYGLSEEAMVQTYNCFDVNASTTQGEGFGLTTLESMACGVSQILPDWSALGDWAKGAAWMIPCTSTAIGPPYVNVIGGIADEKAFIQALQQTYANDRTQEVNAKAAYERSQEPRFNWATIGQQYVEAMDCAFGQHQWANAMIGPTAGVVCSRCHTRKM